MDMFNQANMHDSKMEDPDGDEFEPTGLAKVAGLVGEGLHRNFCEPAGAAIGGEIRRIGERAVEKTVSACGSDARDALNWLLGETDEDDYYNV